MDMLEGYRHEQGAEFPAEAFKDLLDHATRLNRIADLAGRLRREGLNIDEFEDLTKLVGEALRHSVGGAELHLATVIESLPKAVQHLELRRVDLRGLKGLMEGLRGISPFPEGPVRLLRRWIRDQLGLPPPLTPSELVDELDKVLDGLLEELRRHTELIKDFLRVVRPEVVPWLIKLVEKNPGHARGALGEALCIWWLREVLGRREGLWANTRGPVRVCGVEVDAISLQERSVGLAEVKVAEVGSGEYDKAVEQLSRATEVFEGDLDALREIFKHAPAGSTVSAVVIITPRGLGNYKEELLKTLRRAFRNKKTAVYDAEDIKSTLQQWPYRAKEHYIELFEAVRGALEGRIVNERSEQQLS